MTNFNRTYEVYHHLPLFTISLTIIVSQVAVIDEIQMVKDYQRGWAWTRALLGVPANEIHVCGEAAAIDIVKEIMVRKIH